MASGKPLIPLLVGGAVMPLEAELPPALAALARRQAVVLSDSNWRGDVQRLVDSLQPTLTLTPAKPRVNRWALAGAGAAAAVLLGGYAAWHVTLNTPPLPPVVASPSVDITGRWTAQVRYDWGDQHDEVFEFKQLGNTLHGSASYLTGRLTIEHASLEGDWLRFSTRSQEMIGDSPWKETLHRYIGKVSADHIAFTLETTGGYSVHPPIEFVARPVRP